MGPRHALFLSYDGIRLARLDGGDWSTLGQVAIDDPTMRGALAKLRRDAAAANDGPFETIVFLPETQILYDTVDVPEGADADAVIGAALEGRTPYGVADLAWDSAGSGTRRQIGWRGWRPSSGPPPRRWRRSAGWR